MRVVRPQVLVALGATAAQALFGASFSVTRQRGQVIQSGLAPVALATVHPSSILRAPDADSRHEQMRLFVNDLKRVASLVASTRAA
jgi:uracil-DNA glycosylase family 4